MLLEVFGKEMAKQASAEDLRRLLSDIHPVTGGGFRNDLNYVSKVSDPLPLPYMVFLAIMLGTDCKYVRQPEEKTAWSIALSFKGVLFRLEYAKFGMRIATEGDANDPLVDEFLRVLYRAFPKVDQVLQPQVNQLIEDGNITIPNRHHLLRQRYDFFRKCAQEAFGAPKPRLDEILRPTKGVLGVSKAVDLLKSDREGFFFGTSAIDAYFSWLEHVLVLTLPFVNYSPLTDDLAKIISGSWIDKLKRVWDVAGNGIEKKLYDDLRDIKERFRNASAHGGFEKNNASLAVHFPIIGAIPAVMSRFTNSIHYRVFPLDEASFADVCLLFDAVDSLLHSGQAKYGLRYAESGLDVPFDEKSCAKYNDAMQSDEEFEEFLEERTYFVERHINMDW
jgi:hypothetical protein